MFPTRRLTLLVLAATVLGSSSDLSLDEPTLDLHELARRLEPRGDLHFPLHARGTNKDNSTPTYKNAKADIESRVNDLLPRMTLDEKTAQLIQGDINGWMDMSSPFDNTLTHNATGLASMLTTRSGSIWAGYQTPWTKLAYAIKTGQDYLMQNTTLGIPAVFQSEGLHGYINNGTIFPSPLGMASSFNTDLLNQVATALGNEAEGTGVKQLFAPVLDLSRELRWGRVEENFGEDPYLTGELGHAFVTGLQVGSNSTSTPTKGTYRLSAMCKHFAAFGSPYNGLNIAPVFGGERELRSTYLPPFKRACVEGDALALMSAYSSYDGVPAMANSHLMVDILRNEWGYKHFVMGDAGDVDLLYSLHGVCPSAPLDAARECAAKTAVMRIQGEMGGGTYTYQTLADQVRAGKVDVKYIDETVKSLLRVKFKLGLFENPYPASDPYANLRTAATRKVLHQIEQEQLVLLENKNSVLPLDPKSLGSIAIIGPQSNRVSFGDYVFTNASDAGITPLDGVKSYLSSMGSSTSVKFVEGAKLWSSDTSGIQAAVDAAKNADVAVVFVGTWTLDQNNLWTPGTNATTGEHNDLSGLGLVGASMDLVKAVQGAAKKTVVVFVSGKPVAEPWIQAHADAVIQQFYPGELGGQAIAELLFGAFSPSGKLPVSFPRSVGTAPAFYNYLKGGRPIDAGAVLDDGNLKFGHSYVFDTPVPIWSFGHGLSYVNFTYSGMTLSKSTISRNADFSVSVTLKNNGAISAKEVVQVYATDDVSSAVTPNTKLVGFAKVELAAGASQTITVPIRNEDLKLWTAESKWAVEAGTFTIRVGTSDQTYAKATLTVQ